MTTPVRSLRRLALCCLATASLALVSCCGGDDDEALPNDDLSVELSWFSTSTDFDLRLEGPDNRTYRAATNYPVADSISTSGDFTRGPNTEFIDFDDSAPDGAYTAIVVLYGSIEEADFDLRVSTAVSEEVRGDILQSGDSRTYAFIKDGNELRF